MVAERPQTFSDLLRRARREAELTQEELAERAGVSARGISDLERGIIRAPRRDTLELLLDALDIPAERRTVWYATRDEAISQPVPSKPTPALSSKQPLVGRDRELDVLRRQLDLALVGQGSLVLVSGEAGIGKTSLVRWLVGEAERDGALVLSGGCYDLTTTPPYGPWVEIVRSYPISDEQLPELPDQLRQGGGMAGIASQLELFELARDFFADVSEKRLLVLVLEDLHWSDPASLELLRYLSRSLAGSPILFIITYRDDELTRRRVLFQLLPVLARETDAVRIELRRFTSDQMREMVSARGLSDADATRLVAYLDHRTSGNPLFATELLRALESEGVLRVMDESSQLGELDESYLPSFVLQIIERRLISLDSETRRALEVAAIIGQEVPFDVWEPVSDLNQELLDATVEQAIAAHILEEAPGHQGLRFTHALIREVLYEGVVPTRRRNWHRSVADALIAFPHPDPDTVAFHLDQANDPRRVDWLIQAGDRAYRTYAWRTAIDRFDAAAQRMADDPERRGEHGWLLYRTGRMLRLSSPVDGVARLQEAERVARAIGDDILAAYALADRGLGRCFAGDLRRGMDEMAAGVAALDALPADHLRQDPRVATWIADALRTDASSVDGSAAPPNVRRSALALWLAIVGRHAEAIASGESCRQEVTGATRLTEVAAGSLGDAYHALGVAYAELGRPDAADAAFSQAREIYRSIDHHELVWGTLTSHLWLVICPYFATDLVRCRNLVEEAEAARSRGHGALGDSTFSPLSAASLAVAFLAGRWVEVREMIDVELRETNPVFRAYTRCAFGYIAWGQGDDDVAWQQIHAMFADGPQTEPGVQPFGSALELQRLAINLELDHGNLNHARAWLEMQERWLAWSGAVRRQADVHLLWARYHLLDGDLSSSRHFATRALEHASEPRQPLALLAVHRFLGHLDTLDGRITEAETHLQAALDLAEACQAPFERALTLLELARLRVAQGLTSDARGLLDEIRTICEPLKAQPTLDQVAALEAEWTDQPTETPFGLTPRELDVLRLVAEGLTDPEVAKQLFVSPRTVSSHLTSIYTKLGVSSRAAATRIAVERDML